LKKLRKLRIDIPESYFGDYGGVMFREALDAMHHIEDFDFNIGFNDMRDYGSLEATKGVVGMKGLKRLRYSLSQNEV